MLRIRYSTNKWTAVLKRRSLINCKLGWELSLYPACCTKFPFWPFEVKSFPSNKYILYLWTLLEDTGLNKGIFVGVIEGKLVELLIIGNWLLITVVLKFWIQGLNIGAFGFRVDVKLLLVVLVKLGLLKFVKLGELVIEFWSFYPE